MAEGIPARLSRGEARRFGLVVGAAFVALAGVLFWRGLRIAAFICGFAGITLIVLGVVLPDLLPPVYRAWMGLAHVISRVTTPIFMGIVYFGVVAPIGLVRRLAGGNPLRRPSGDAGLWIVRDDRGRNPKDLERQF